MKHWHECRICKEYFECECGVSHNLSACCLDCRGMQRQQVFMDSIVVGLLQNLAE